MFPSNTCGGNDSRLLMDKTLLHMGCMKILPKQMINYLSTFKKCSFGKDMLPFLHHIQHLQLSKWKKMNTHEYTIYLQNATPKIDGV